MLSVQLALCETTHLQSGARRPGPQAVTLLPAFHRPLLEPLSFLSHHNNSLKSPERNVTGFLLLPTPDYFFPESWLSPLSLPITSILVHIHVRGFTYHKQRFLCLNPLPNPPLLSFKLREPNFAKYPFYMETQNYHVLNNYLLHPSPSPISSFCHVSQHSE